MTMSAWHANICPLQKFGAYQIESLQNLDPDDLTPLQTLCAADLKLIRDCVPADHPHMQQHLPGAKQ